MLINVRENCMVLYSYLYSHLCSKILCIMRKLEAGKAGWVLLRQITGIITWKRVLLVLREDNVLQLQVNKIDIIFVLYSLVFISIHFFLYILFFLHFLMSFLISFFLFLFLSFSFFLFLSISFYFFLFLSLSFYFFLLKISFKISFL
jgi:hypothetical protein